MATEDEQGRVTATGEGSVEITAALSGVEDGPLGTADIVDDMTMTRALVALYTEAGGSAWTNVENWSSDRPLRAWYGVETDLAGRVTKLDLAGNGLGGRMPPALRDSTFRAMPLPARYRPGWAHSRAFWALDLHANTVNGTIPSELGATLRARKDR